MSVENNYITVAYKMYVTDAGSNEEEALVEECTSEHPFQFISNLGVALKSFEDKVANLKKGESFDFVIPAADAYGDFQEEINGRFDKEHIFEGNIIPLAGPEGERFNGTVIEIKDNAVTIDLNHPRAGQDLHFVGTVVENREATNEEVTGMLNMLSGEGCGCGCGCGGDCGGGCDSGDGCGCGHCH